MDVNEHAEMDEAPTLGNRRQSYSLVSGDLSTSSTGGSNDNNLSSRINSFHDGEYWPTGSDAWNVLSSSQQGPRSERPYRLKRRNCCETPYNSNIEEREGLGLKRAGICPEAKDLTHGLHGYGEKIRASETIYADTAFEFFQNPPLISGSSSSPYLQPSQICNAVGEGTSSTGSDRLGFMTCFLDGPSLNGTNRHEANLTGQSAGNGSKEKGGLMNYRSTEMVQTPLNQFVGSCPASIGFDSGTCLESAYPLPVVEGGGTGTGIDCGVFDHVDHSVDCTHDYMHSGRSRSSKRRMFISGLETDPSVLQASQASSRTGFADNNDGFVVSNDDSTGAFTSSHGMRETGEGTYESPGFIAPRDPSHMSRSLFARNMRRTARSTNLQNLFPRMSFSEPQQLGSGDANIPDQACLNDFNSASMSFWDRSTNSCWSNEDGGFRRGNNRSAPLRSFEGNHVRGVPGRGPSWPRGSTNDSPSASSSASSLVASMPNSGALNRNMLPPPASINRSVSESPPTNGGHGEGSRLPMFLERRRQDGITGSPYHRTSSRGLRMLPVDGERRNRFLSEILSSLEHAWRSEELSYQELVMLDPSLLFGGAAEAHDRHGDLRLDVDNMSYEELLALEERIGNVSTGLSDESISVCVSEGKFSSLDATVATISQESDNKCSVCQEEFVEEDKLGRLDCSHGYHITCIRKWLLLKNQCPICKAPAYSKS